MLKVNKKIYDVVPEEAFITSEGEELRNLHELLDALNRATIEQFRKHVNDEKNDFANWIRNSVKDPELADELEKTTDFDETKKIIEEHIKFLEGEEEHGSKTSFENIPDDLEEQSKKDSSADEGKVDEDSRDKESKDNIEEDNAGKKTKEAEQSKEADKTSTNDNDNKEDSNIKTEEIKQMLEFKKPDYPDNITKDQKYLLSKKEALHNFLIGAIVGFFAGIAAGIFLYSFIG